MQPQSAFLLSSHEHAQSNRNVFIALLAMTFVSWAFSIIGTAAPAIGECSIDGSRVAFGYWSACAGNTCSSYGSSNLPAWLQASQAFTILSVVSASGVLLCVCLLWIYKSNTMLNATGITALCTFVCVSLALFIFIGKMSSEECLDGLDYAGAMQIIVLVFNIVLMSGTFYYGVSWWEVCCAPGVPPETFGEGMMAVPFSRGEGEWSVMTKRVSWVACLFFSSVVLTFELIAISTPHIFLAKVSTYNPAIGYVRNVGYWQACAYDCYTWANSWIEGDNVHAGVKVAQAFSVLSIVFIAAASLLLFLSWCFHSPRVGTVIGLLTAANFACESVALGFLIKQNGSFEYDRFDYGGGLTVAAMVIDLVIVSICFVFVYYRQSFSVRK